MNVNQMNVFSWIRDAVRRSVLLGFSDAMSDLGAAPEDELSTTMKGLIDKGSTAKVTNKSTNSRKRLGKSLKEIETKKAG